MEWKTVKLGEVCNIRRGASPRPIQEFLSSQGMPWIKISDATATDSKYIDKTKEFIIEEGVSHSVLIEPGTLIVSNSATPGLPKISRITACVHDGWLVIDNFRGILKDFLYYKFIEIRSILGNQANGSVFMNLKTDIVKEFLIHIPDIEKQIKIVSILSSLDDKIDNNNRINRNLEAQAQALFKSWFVDFEPWGGVMPDDWKEGKLGDLCITNKRTSNGKYNTYINYIDTGSVTKNRLNDVQVLNPTIDKIPSRARRLVSEGDIIYSSVRPNQCHYMFMYDPSPDIVVSTGFVVITANWSAYRYYIYQYIIQESTVSTLQAIAEQSVSTYPSINASDITNLNIIIPSNDIIEKFANVMNKVMQRIEELNKESKRLAALRDSLLPKLMKGEIAL